MMYYVKIKSWNEVDNEMELGKYFVYGENFGDAANKIAKYCGENNVEYMAVELVAEDISIVPDDFDLNTYKSIQIW